MARPLRLVAICGALLGLGCGNGVGDEGSTPGDSGPGDNSRCDVYDGKDEYLECVCEDVKPCLGISREECPQVIRGALKYGQHDAGLECTQALGDLFECEFALTCEQSDALAEYWNQCAYTDPLGTNQPFCRRESRTLAETCESFPLPCEQG